MQVPVQAGGTDVDRQERTLTLDRVATDDKSWASSAAVRASMQGNKRRDTIPELLVRRLVHAAGLRYRVDFRPLPNVNRRADLVFTRAKVAVFVDGCYWHGCPIHGSRPQTNSAYWTEKILANRIRDAETDGLLANAGWIVVRAWEHEDPRTVAEKVIREVGRFTQPDSDTLC